MLLYDLLYLGSISAACVIALKKLVFLGEIRDKENDSVTFEPTHSVYVYETFFESDSSTDEVNP